MNRILFIVSAFLLLFNNVYSNVNDGWYLSTMMGGSISGPSTLTFNFNDQDTLSMSADYNNRSFDDSHWWSFRIENWQLNHSLGIELIHHKIYLDNTNDIVESFSLSDGYNLLFLNWGKRIHSMNYRFGLGVVLGHMDVTIAGRDRYIEKGFNGHYLTGPAVHFNAERILWQSDTHFLSCDLKFTAAYAEVPISADNNELAVAPDYAVHISIGYGSKPAALASSKITNRLGYFFPLFYPYIVGNTLLNTTMLPTSN